MQTALTLIRKIPKQVISAFFLICVIIFFGFYLRSIDWSQLRHLHLAWGYILLATTIASTYRYWGVLIWRFLLTDLGAQGLPDFTTLSYVYAKAWMGRYIPGTVTWIAGKVYMASSHGIPKSRLAVASLLEGGMQIMAVMVVSMLLLGFDTRLDVLPMQYKILMIGCAGILLSMLTPAIFNRIVRLVFLLMKRKEMHTGFLINTKAVVRSFLLYAIGSFVIGLAEFFIARAVYPALPWHDYWFVVGAFNLSGALGMLAIGVPSGIGVRDGAILLLLSVILPKELALVITVSSRLWSAVADVIFFAMASAIHQLHKPQQQRISGQ